MTCLHRTVTHGFTLLELLVVISIIALLVAILLPVLSNARESAMQVRCASNIRQVGMARVLYSYDFNNVVPGWARDWHKSLHPYTGHATGPAMQAAMGCPAREGTPFHYGVTVGITGYADLDRSTDRATASERLFHGEGSLRVIYRTDGQAPNSKMWYGHSGQTVNVLFLDQHVESMVDELVPQFGNAERPGWLSPDGSPYDASPFWGLGHFEWVELN